MGQVLHGSATTTEAIRRAIQHSEASLRALAKRYGINQKTVAKWKRRTSVVDVPTGPKEPRSTVLSVEDEAIVVAFRRHTLLPLDDCLYALQATIPHLTRSSLHRCLQRHGISRLPEVDGDKPDRRKFKSYPICYFHIDIAEVRTEQGKLHLFVAIDRTSKFAFVELHEKATTRVSGDFLRHLIEAVPYKVHTVLTDNGIQFTMPGAGGSAVPDIREAMAKGELFRAHAFEYACAKAGIDHRTTKPKHPWTNGQVERMNRTIKDATVKRFHYDDHDQLRRHLADFVSAYNFGRRLKTLKGLTPYEFICKRWTTEPDSFTLNPLQQMPGLKHLAREGIAKIYSLHAPEVECIGKGKPHKPYEFGVKVSVATTLERAKGGQFVTHIMALPGNPYDGHTLATIIPDMEHRLGAPIQRVLADAGYRGHNAPPDYRFKIYTQGQKRGVTQSIKRELRRRSAIEPAIGHLKSDHRMDRNYLALPIGEANNAVLPPPATTSGD